MKTEEEIRQRIQQVECKTRTPDYYSAGYGHIVKTLKWVLED